MRLPMSRQLRVVSELICREIFTAEELDVPASYFKDFQNKTQVRLNSLINLKEASIKFVQFVKKQSQLFLEQNFRRIKGLLIRLSCICNHITVQSTISIAALVKRQRKKNACGCYDGSCQFDGVFHFVRDIYHNKAAEAKIKGC
jgi:DNA polymerase-3 subunit alpha